MRVVVPFAVLAAFRWNGIASAGLNNIALLALWPEWQPVAQSVELPQCRVWTGELVGGNGFDDAVALDPLNQRAWLNSGRAAWLGGRCEAAKQAWQQAVALQPRDVSARLELANASYAEGEVESARSQFRDLGAVKYLHAKGVMAYQRGNYDSARTWYETSFDLSPSRETAQTLSTLYIVIDNRPQKASALWLSLAALTDTESSDHWWAVGQAAEIEKDWPQALAAYERGLAVETAPHRLIAFYTQSGLASEQLADYAAAAGFYEQALARQPDSMWLHLRMGSLLQKGGDAAGAWEWYERANEIAPHSEWPEYHQALLRRSEGRNDEARALLLIAHLQNSRNPSVLYYLAVDAHERGDLQGAIAYMQSAADIQKAAGWRWAITLGDWLAEAGRCDEATAAYEQVLNWQPGDSGVQQKLEQLLQKCQ